MFWVEFINKANVTIPPGSCEVKPCYYLVFPSKKADDKVPKSSCEFFGKLLLGKLNIHPSIPTQTLWIVPRVWRGENLWNKVSSLCYCILVNCCFHEKSSSLSGFIVCKCINHSQDCSTLLCSAAEFLYPILTYCSFKDMTER